ncbi:MAG: carboxylate--amine ligase [bacterium]
MKLLIIGGGQGQLRAIRRARQAGLETVVSDMNPAAPGALLADEFARADTFDAAATLQAARRHRVDGIATLGTDQPLLTLTRAAGELGLPHSLSIDQALALTNKRYMKRWFDECGIPHSPYRIIDAGFHFAQLQGLQPPLVLKPVDSQGQRGVVRLESADQIPEYLPETLRFSRDGYAVVEEFYPGQEITFSGWVRDGRMYPLTATDRVTRPFYPHIGVCIAHTYPSRCSAEHGAEIVDISRRIVEGFGIRQGPLYFQMLIGPQGLRVNEVAARIGGAYEDEFIPALTGIDIDMLNFAEALGRPGRFDSADTAALQAYQYPAAGALAVLLFFTEPMLVASVGPETALRQIPGVVTARYLQPPGSQIGPMHNSTGRAGYVIIQGSSSAEVNRSIDTVYAALELRDSAGRNRVLDFARESYVV